MSVKINALELENVKRIKAVKIDPSQNGLTIIGGDNNQGKTSVLDSIAWALGGDRNKPSNAAREGSTIPPVLKVTLSNGIIVERKGKNSSLKVTDPSGKKAGQNLLDYFIEQLALDLPKFMNKSNKEKANVLLNIIGVGDQLAIYQRQENELYQERLTLGRIADQKAKFAKEQPFFEDAPKDLVSPQELINQQQAILAKNGENQRKREKVTQYEYQVKTLTDEVARYEQMLKSKQEELNKATYDLSVAKTDALDLLDQSTDELEKNLAEIEETNRKVRANLDKEKAEEEAVSDVVAQREESLAKQLAEMRKRKRKLVDPLQFEMSIMDQDLQSYVPTFGWEMAPASEKQIKALEKYGIYPDSVDNAGKATLLLDRLHKRQEEGLATPKQIRLLENKGFKQVGTWSFESARKLINRIAASGWRVPNGIDPATYKEGD